MNSDQQNRPLLIASALTLFGCLAFAGAARLLNSNIGYGNALNCDAWYFFGLQFNFPEIYATRMFYQPFRFPALVPWIYLADNIPFQALNWLKFFFYFAVTCIGFLWFNYRLYGLRVAVLTTVLFCCSTTFLGILSTDYVTAAGLSWISLLLAATVEAGRARRPLLWSIAAGIFVAMCFYTHLPTGLFVFAIPLFFFAAPESAKHQHSLIRFGAYLAGCIVGFLLLTGIVSLYNWSLGGSIFFLQRQIRFAIAMLRDPAVSAGNRTPGLGWLTTGSTVVMMELAIVASVVVLGLKAAGPNRRKFNGDGASMAAVAFLLTAALTMGWELSGRVLLQVNVYAPWIFPVLFAALGGALSQVKAVHNLSWRAMTATILAIACVLLIAARTDVGAVSSDHLLQLKIAFGLAFVVSLAALYRSRFGLLAVAPLTAFIAVHYPTQYGQFPWAAHGLNGRDMTFQAATALKILDKLKIEGRPAFWINAGQRENIAIPRSYLHCRGFAASFPSITPGAGFESRFPPLSKEMLAKAKVLIVVAPGSDLTQQAVPKLRDLGFDAKTLGEWPIGSGPLHNSMTVLELNRSNGTR